MSNPSNIQVGFSSRVVWVRVEGKGSFFNSSGLKDFAQAKVTRGNRQFVVDLQECPVMDSTFMGTLAGIALRLREMGQGALHLIRLNDRNGNLLRNLGLDQLFTLGLGELELPGEWQTAIDTARPLPEEPAQPDRKEQAQTMLEAHEALVQAAPENRVKFKDVLEFLKQDLGQ
jgi:anti-anti-sigma regulatory factor